MYNQDISHLEHSVNYSLFQENTARCLIVAGHKFNDTNTILPCHGNSCPPATVYA